MTPRLTVLALALVGAGAAYAFTLHTVAAQPRAEDDTRRFLPVENGGVFWTMGARVWKLHLPATDLRGRTHVVAKMRTDREEFRPLATCALKAGRDRNAPLDVTFILFADKPSGYPEKTMVVAIDSAEFYGRRELNLPVRQVNQFSMTSDPVNPVDGVLLAKYSSRDTTDWAEFSLWVE